MVDSRSDGREEAGGPVLALETAGGGGWLCGKGRTGAEMGIGAELIAVTAGGGASSGG